MLNTVDDVIDLVKIQMSSAASALTSDGLEAACNNAMAELGWKFPVTDDTKSLWVVKRAVRHACFILWTASAQKFKYKQVNLQQRFEHYEKLLKNMDTEYENALSSNTNIFSSSESYKMFGTAIKAGFVYDNQGRDLTYNDFLRYVNVGI